MTIPAQAPAAVLGGAPPRRRHTAGWVAGAVVVVLVVVAVVVATRPSAQATSVDSPLIGHAAPPLTTCDFSAGSPRLARR